MARSSFNAITTWNRLHLRTDTFGPTEVAGTVTSWQDANGGTAASPNGSGPAYDGDPLGDGTGPGAVLQNGATGGFDSGLSLSGDFTLFALLRVESIAAGFYVWLGDDDDEASVYADASTLYLFTNGNVSFLQTNSNNTIYRLIWTRSGTTNTAYLAGALSNTRNGSETIGLEWGSSAGGSFELTGTMLAMGAADGTALSGGDITSLDAAMIEEEQGIGDGGGGASDDFNALQMATNLMVFGGGFFAKPTGSRLYQPQGGAPCAMA